MSGRIPFHAWFIAGVLAAFLSLIAMPAIPAENGASSAPLAGANSAEALSVYDVGKRSYDAGDYTAALRSFMQAARLEPDNARWQYNIGLTLRQLEHFQAAREAFLAARQLDPEYKREEIDKKLISMGFDASGAPARSRAANESEDDFPFDLLLFVFLPIFLVGALIVGITIFIIRKNRTTRTGAGNIDLSPPPAPAALEAQYQRLRRLSPKLVSAEHALRLGEDHDLRALLDRATGLEHAAYSQLETARAGSSRALDSATRLIREAEPLARKIDARVAAIDPAAIAALAHEGGDASKRSGCFFCARPLANAKFRRIVPLRSQQGDADVLACPACVKLIAHGETPNTTLLDGENGPRHWSEEPGFDPYLNRHVPYPAATQVPAWKFTPSRSFADLALLAAGGALGAAAAYASTKAFDLDLAGNNDLAREAAHNAAQRAANNHKNNSSRDYS